MRIFKVKFEAQIGEELVPNFSARNIAVSDSGDAITAAEIGLKREQDQQDDIQREMEKDNEDCSGCLESSIEEVDVRVEGVELLAEAEE